MVLEYFGCRKRIGDLADAAVYGRHGISAEGLRKAAARFGFTLTARAVDIAGLATIPKPAILHWQFRHWVVIERVSRKGAVLLDPALGRRNVAVAEICQKFTGVALLIQPASAPQPTADDVANPGWRLLASAITRRRLIIFLGAAAIFTTVAQLLGVCLAKATEVLFTRILPLRAPGDIAAFGIAVFGLLAGKVLLEQARAIGVARVEIGLDTGVLGQVLRHVLQLPYAYLQSRGTGELSSRLNSYFFLRQILTERLVAGLIDLAFIGVYGWALFTIDRTALAVAGAVAGATLTVALLRNPRDRDLSVEEFEAESEKSQMLSELLHGAKQVKTAGAEEQVLLRWRSTLNRQANATAERSYHSAVWDHVSNGIQQSLPLLVIFAAAAQVLAGSLSLPAIFAALLMASAMTAPLASLVQTGQHIRLAGTYWQRLEELMATRPERTSGLAARISGSVAVRNLTFSYPGEKRPVLQNVNFNLAPGKMTAIVGATGSGKSTLAAVLIGLYEPSCGEILFGNRPLSSLHLGALRRQVGMVLQEDVLFQGSILENILRNHPESSFGNAVAAAKLACVHDEIVAMPAGYETFVSERGGNLSGGQRQRIALARALVGSPTLLVLDESSSHLDAGTAARVDAELAKLSCTRVIIAHRLSSIVNADAIIVLREGRVAEIGRHAALLKRQGTYAQLYEAQISVDGPDKAYHGSAAV